MDVKTAIANLDRHGFHARWFETGAAAAEYLCGELHHTTVGFGGSVTAEQLGLYESLSRDNQVFWHWKDGDREEAQRQAAQAQIYILSANALSETGEIVNIDGNGNRLASMFYGHQRVIFVVGINKLTEDLPAAISRARNIASPLNARRLHRKTPCAQTEPMRCHNCSSSERICSGMSVLMEAMGSIPQTDVLLIGETLGF